MARYIDADALTENIKRVYCTDCNSYNEVRCRACGTGDALDMVEDAPTADVAPRAEVNDLIYKLECLLCHATGGRLSKHTYDLRTMEAVVTDCDNETYNDGFAEGYKECAREIFVEIEKIILDNTYPDFNREHKPVNIWKATTGWDAFYELKKKYAESRDKYEN